MLGRAHALLAMLGRAYTLPLASASRTHCGWRRPLAHTVNGVGLLHTLSHSAGARCCTWHSPLAHAALDIGYLRTLPSTLTCCTLASVPRAHCRWRRSLVPHIVAYLAASHAAAHLTAAHTAAHLTAAHTAAHLTAVYTAAHLAQELVATVASLLLAPDTHTCSGRAGRAVRLHRPCLAALFSH